MDTAPDSPIAAATPMVSLWQNNMTGLKARMLRRAEAHDHRRRGGHFRELQWRQPGPVIMNAPTLEQIAAAERLGVSLHFTNSPLTIARLCEMVEELQQRVAALEDKRGLRK